MCDLNQQGECCLARSETEDIWTRWAEGSLERAKRWAVSPAFRWEPNVHWHQLEDQT